MSRFGTILNAKEPMGRLISSTLVILLLVLSLSQSDSRAQCPSTVPKHSAQAQCPTVQPPLGFGVVVSPLPSGILTFQIPACSTFVTAIGMRAVTMTTLSSLGAIMGAPPDGRFKK